MRNGLPAARRFIATHSPTSYDNDRAVVAQVAADEAAALVEHDLCERLGRQIPPLGEEAVQPLLSVQLTVAARLDDPIGVQDDGGAGLERPPQLLVRLSRLDA